MFVFTGWAEMEMFMPCPHCLFLTHLSLTTHLPSLALDASEVTNAAGQGTHHQDALTTLDGLSQLGGPSQRLKKASVPFAIGYVTYTASGGWPWLMWFI